MNEYRQQLLKTAGISFSENRIMPPVWRLISSTEDLSAEFIREFSDKLDWPNLSKFRIFSNEFILEFKDRIHWDFYFRFNAIDFSIMKQFITKTTYLSTTEFYIAHLTSSQIQEIQKLLDFKNIFNK